MAGGLLAAASLVSSSALADTTAPNRGVRIDQLQPASPESAFFRPDGPHNPDAQGVEFAVGLTFEYANTPLVQKIVAADGSTTSFPLVQNALLGRLGASITPLHWLSFDLSLPFALFENGTRPPPVGGVDPAPGKAPGIGDLRAGAHFRPVDTTRFGLILGGHVWAPFGSQASYLSDGQFRGELDLGVAGDVSRALYGCSLNVSPGFFAHRAGDRVAASCAAYVKLDPAVALGVEPSFEALTEAPFGLRGSPANQTQVLFEPLGGLRFRLGGFRIGVGAGPGFGGAMGSAKIRALANFAYVGLGKPPKAPPVGPSDRDLDKIPDDVDACPDEAGPPNDNPKLNGCPVHDRDGDGIPDDEDFCPDRAGIPYPNPKANGCPDSDNDGLPDPIDQCVNEPGAPPSGCPKHAHLTPSGFKIEPPIEFTAGDKLKNEGKIALEEVAATMRANPKIEQVSISIGTKGVKAAVSDNRAQQVLLILRGANLDSSRYEVVLRDDQRAGLVQVRLVK